MIIHLRPIKESTVDYEKMEKEILRIFRRDIYIPLLKSFQAPAMLQNSPLDDIVAALRANKIQFSQGKFIGKFNSKISKALKALGATWKGGAWNIPKTDLPQDVKSEIAASLNRYEKMAEKADITLSQILPADIAEAIKIEHLFDSTLWRVNGQFEESIKGITVAPKLTEAQSAKISAEYTTNLNRYIKDFTEKEILELRQKIAKAAVSGNRHENMISVIQKSYGVTQRKAKFLARQETSLMMTKFKETRYLDAGVSEYKWGCVAGSKAHPVRRIHKALEGKIFSWKNPPITDQKGNRNNPGEDYNCRCFAKPILKTR